HGLPDGLDELCVQAEGLDESGNFLVGGSATALITRHQTTELDVQMSNAFARCPALPGGDLGPPDLAIPICPVNAIFCDDFETGDFSKWTAHSAKQDAGTTTVQSTTTAHG